MTEVILAECEKNVIKKSALCVDSSPRMHFNSAVYLFADAIVFLDMSVSKRVVASIPTLYKRRVYARSSVILFHSCVEALVNYLLFSVAFKKMPYSLKRHLERLPFDVKLVEITKDCCKKKRIEDSPVFSQLKELHELRNSFMHPKMLVYPGKLKSLHAGTYSVTFGRSEKESRFKYSKLHKFFNYIDYGDAQKAKKIVVQLFEWIKKNIDESGRNSLRSMFHIDGMPKVKPTKNTKFVFKMDADALVLFEKSVLKTFRAHFD